MTTCMTKVAIMTWPTVAESRHRRAQYGRCHIHGCVPPPHLPLRVLCTGAYIRHRCYSCYSCRVGRKAMMAIIFNNNRWACGACHHLRVPVIRQGPINPRRSVPATRESNSSRPPSPPVLSSAACCSGLPTVWPPRPQRDASSRPRRAAGMPQYGTQAKQRRLQTCMYISIRL